MNSARDRKSTRLNSSHGYISYAVFCLKKKNTRSCTRCPRRPEPSGQTKPRDERRWRSFSIFFLLFRPPPRSTLFPYTTLFRSRCRRDSASPSKPPLARRNSSAANPPACSRSEEHTSELQSRLHLVCRLLLEKKKIKNNKIIKSNKTTIHPHLQ